MKITKEQQKKLAAKLADPPEVRFQRFFKKAMIIGIIATVVIAMFIFVSFASNNQAKVKQISILLIFLLGYGIVSGIIWYLWKSAFKKHKANEEENEQTEMSANTNEPKQNYADTNKVNTDNNVVSDDKQTKYQDIDSFTEDNDDDDFFN